MTLEKLNMRNYLLDGACAYQMRIRVKRAALFDVFITIPEINVIFDGRLMLKRFNAVLRS